jgi:hypothetical protein
VEEHGPYKAGVAGSSPAPPTNSNDAVRLSEQLCLLYPSHMLASVRPPDSRLKIWIAALFATAAIAVCLSRAMSLAWLSDDSFISFRYARNLIQGHGLVYNVGEYVEGYTNLLWTLLMAGGMILGVSPEVTAHVAGVVFWLLLVSSLALWSWRRADQQRFIPLAAVLVLVMGDYQTWATGALETSMFAFLSVAGILLACRVDAGKYQMLLAGTLLAAAVGTRPDGVIFAAVGVAASWFLNTDVSIRKRLARSFFLALPLMVGAAALVTFKLRYYGDLFPTAFYSKSASDPYYGQGLFYVGLYLAKNWFILPLVLLLAFLSRKKLTAVLKSTNLVFLAAFFGFVAYVAHSGGDFMFARRLLPAMPFLFLVLEDLLLSIPGRALQTSLFVFTVLAACFPYPIYPKEPHFIRGVANEPAFYSQPYLDARQAQASVAARALAGLPVRAVFEGGMCMFGYYSDLPYLAESYGLTQYSLAKKPLTTRGRVGHEKSVDDQWATENNIHFIFSNALPPVPRSAPRRGDEIYFGDMLKAKIWIYRDTIMDRLRDNPEVRFIPIEETLAAARREIGLASYAEGQRIYDYLERFYFRTASPEKQRLAGELKRQVEAKKRAENESGGPGRGEAALLEEGEQVLVDALDADGQIGPGRGGKIRPDRGLELKTDGLQ